MNRTLTRSQIALLACGLLLAVAPLAGSPAGRSTASMDIAAVDASEEVDARSGATAARRGLALPYFSFARGLRRIGG